MSVLFSRDLCRVHWCIQHLSTQVVLSGDDVDAQTADTWQGIVQEHARFRLELEIFLFARTGCKAVE